MNTANATFQRALSKLLIEIFNGPSGEEAYILNPGDPGLLRQLSLIDAGAASIRPMRGKTTIAAHADHVRCGLALLNRWAPAKPTRGPTSTGTPVGGGPSLPTVSGMPSGLRTGRLT